MYPSLASPDPSVEAVDPVVVVVVEPGVVGAAVALAVVGSGCKPEPSSSTKDEKLGCVKQGLCGLGYRV